LCAFLFFALSFHGFYSRFARVVTLYALLQNNIGRYVFSRAQIEQFELDDEVDTIAMKAAELLRSANNPKDKGAGGEPGEILLYLFLEQKLGAPKLLSKIELKTAGNQYVFGSDGVHLLHSADGVQLILGESKIVGDLKSAASNAFVSILKVQAEPANEVRLVETSIFKEAFSKKETAKYIKSLIIPSKRDLSIAADKAFGIFLGYTLGINAKGKSNQQYRDAVQAKMLSDISEIAPYIAKRIADNHLENYSFYFYILPFDDAEHDRAAFINRLKGGGTRD
jgi:hypothetical protein